ncbi:MAG: 16S rRNA (guanine(966)-N(2))-methyltransferase RsmD [Dehalococcoidia bacterium]|nr:16S rRNA (guanine(966)-N(2))-methyltransferase RsmD [Dehalococcoidia bacterium]
MRVVGGKARGMTIMVPSVPDIRPTTDLVRGAMFSMLEARGAVEGKRVLDLFAGSGALGIEALSRGATHADLVEQNSKACATIRKNLMAIHLEDQASVVALPVARALGGLNGSYDLVFMDPPYANASEMTDVIDRLVTGNLLDEGSTVVVEQSSRNRRDFARAGEMRLEQEKTYGDTAVSIYIVDHDMKELHR